MKSYIVCPLSKQITPRCFLLRMNAYLWGKGGYTILINQVYTLNAETLVKKVGQLNEEELKKMRRNIALVMGFMI